MEILCISKNGKSWRLRLGRLSVIAVLVAVVGFGSFAFVQGMVIGFNDGERLATAQGPNRFSSLGLMVREQQKQVAELEQDYEHSLKTVAARLGGLQAEVVRLNALGGRLVDIGELDADEFDFSQAPAVGGPEGTGLMRQSADMNDIVVALRGLDIELAASSAQLAALEGLILERQLREESTPSGRPVESGWVSSGFGRRLDPLSGQREFHRGIDFAGRRGSNVIAVASGIVAFAGRRAGYGYMVEINHGNGYVTRYAHNKKNLVSVGESVSKGQPIGLMGSTGRATGPHVHYEVLKDGKILNPLKMVATQK